MDVEIERIDLIYLKGLSIHNVVLALRHTRNWCLSESDSENATRFVFTYEINFNKLIIFPVYLPLRDLTIAERRDYFPNNLNRKFVWHRYFTENTERFK
jgi:hypothetical protein